MSQILYIKLYQFFQLMLSFMQKKIIFKCCALTDWVKGKYIPVTGHEGP
jgi:hypothetical protein